MMIRMYMYCIPRLLIVLLFQADISLSNCDRNYGPSGGTHCFLNDMHYTDYQWGICLTAKYIQTFSKGKYMCRDRTATYCYYQCMLELHGRASGPVSSDCLCKQGETPNSNLTVLPSSCFSPSGDECDWYENCLEKRYPCRNTGASYAVDYAKKFCNLYTERYENFSNDGRKWIDDVRKCLQVNLVPTLRPYQNLTCQRIMKHAFDSHVPCYTNPTGIGSSSYCSLSFTDKLKVFWTVKSAFADKTTVLPSIYGLFETLKECLIYHGRALIDKVRKFILEIEIFQEQRDRKRRSETNIEQEDWLKDHAYDIGENIAKIRQWEEKGIIWFASITNATGNEDTPTGIEVIIGEQKAFDLNYERNVTTNMTLEVEQLTDKVKQGNLVINVGDYTVRIVRSRGCYDIACNVTYNDVESSQIDDIVEPKDDTSSCEFPECWKRTYIIIAAAGALCVILLVLNGICLCRKKRNEPGKVV